MQLQGPNAKNQRNAGPNHSSEETVELFFRVPWKSTTDLWRTLGYPSIQQCFGDEGTMTPCTPMPLVGKQDPKHVICIDNRMAWKKRKLTNSTAQSAYLDISMIINVSTPIYQLSLGFLVNNLMVSYGSSTFFFFVSLSCWL